MSKFYNIEGQSVVVEGVLTESIGKSNSSPAPMTIADFAKTHKVDAYIKKPTEETVKKAEKELGVKFGPQLKNYLMTYGGLSYKFVEFEGLAENSDRIVTITKNVRSLGLDKKFIVVYKIHDEGAYACVDSSDKVYEVEIYAGKVTVKDMKMKFEDYFIHTMRNYKLLKESAVITEAAKELDNPEKVFGKLTLTKYHTYDKENCQINFFGKTYNVKLSIDAMSGDKITQKQADMFTKFNNESDKLSKQAVKALIKYIDGLGDYKDYFDDKELPKTEADMAKYVKPHSLLIDEERYLSLYCDTKWDPEHGVTIGLIPTVKCGDLGEFW